MVNRFRARPTFVGSATLLTLLGLLAALSVQSMPHGIPATLPPTPTPAVLAEHTTAAPSWPASSSTTVPAPTPTPNPADRLAQSPPPTAEDVALYQVLLSSPPPAYDRIAAAAAFTGLDATALSSPAARSTQGYQLGDLRSFWVHDQERGAYEQVEARLAWISQHAYFWLDTASVATGVTGELVAPGDWRAAADSFDATYQAIRAVFGSEPSPGVDGDLRLHILNTDRLVDVGGAFSSADLLPRAVQPYSNECEMFTLSIPGSGGIGSDYYNAILAHELQHMIHFGIDPNEELWVNEGLAQLAQQIAGMRGDNNVNDYLEDVDRSLGFFGNDLHDYGQSYLLIDYLYERFGPPFITALIANPDNGWAGIDSTLATLGLDTTIDALYGDFVAALYLSSRYSPAPPYAFAIPSIRRFRSAAVLDDLPARAAGEVNQYGLDVIRVLGNGQAAITFTGAQTVSLVPTQSPTEQHMWWSQQADMSLSTLTRLVDLRQVSRATLTFHAWWDLEPGWDYAYVLISTDGGQTWIPQRSTSSVGQNPNGQNYGHGLTGRSGWTDSVIGPARWVTETVDLSAYSGQAVLLRFAVITDEGVTHPGLLVDEITIPEIGLVDDVESPQGWTAEGFVWMHNRVPQRWLVQAILIGPHGITVRPLEVVEGAARLEVDLDSLEEVALLIAGQTRFTTATAPYQVDAALR